MTDKTDEIMEALEQIKNFLAETLKEGESVEISGINPMKLTKVNGKMVQG